MKLYICKHVYVQYNHGFGLWRCCSQCCSFVNMWNIAFSFFDEKTNKRCAMLKCSSSSNNKKVMKYLNIQCFKQLGFNIKAKRIRQTALIWWWSCSEFRPPLLWSKSEAYFPPKDFKSFVKNGKIKEKIEVFAKAI